MMLNAYSLNQNRNTTLTILGVVLILYWFLEFWYSAIAINNYSWLLWYSTVGFLLVGIALIVQNVKLTYSLFCALFVIESVWTLDMLRTIFSQQSWLGLAGLLSPVFQIADFYFILYHALIPVSLLLLVMYSHETYPCGWIGATMFAFILAILTYLLAEPNDQVNCLYPALDGCRTIFSFLYGIDTPYRIFVALLGLMLFVFIPTNYILIYLKRKTVHPIVNP